MRVRAHVAAIVGVCLSAGAGAAGSADIVAAARGQVGATVYYDPAYRKLDFPGGDVPPDRGVCTDVVVRALRKARAIDLQQRVNADLKSNWAAYPHQSRWRQSKPDSNIDHRRVPNLMTYFQRDGRSLPLTRAAADYLPGDIVAWDLGRGLLHIGIVSDARSPADTPLVVHNIGAGVREEDILFRYTVIGHYRMPPQPPPPTGL
jgi:uncharacterized protein YijF (DUF1287 family)